MTPSKGPRALAIGRTRRRFPPHVVALFRRRDWDHLTREQWQAHVQAEAERVTAETGIEVRVLGWGRDGWPPPGDVAVIVPGEGKGRDDVV